jgi:hypothetical protein
MQPLDLACRGRRVRLGEQVLDPVVGADPVEQDRARPLAEPRGEDLSVVREDLLGMP